MIRPALVPPLAQGTPVGFRIGQQQVEAIPADGEMVALPAGDPAEPDGGQLGRLAATVAGFDGRLGVGFSIPRLWPQGDGGSRSVGREQPGFYNRLQPRTGSVRSK